MEYEMKEKMKIYWFFSHLDCIGFGWSCVQVRSVGHKWVWLRSGFFDGPYQSRFSKISRKKWDAITQSSSFRTAEEEQWRTYIYSSAHKHDISMTMPCKKVKSHPTKRFGWRYKTFEELEAEVLGQSIKEAV